MSGTHLSYPYGTAEGDLVETRRYAPGDPLKHVLWKVFARRRELLVRAPEVAVDPNPSAIAYFVAGKDDESTAALARFFLQQGLLGTSFIFGADGADGTTSDPALALEWVIGSVRMRKLGGSGLAAFLKALHHKSSHKVLLFVPPRLGDWAERVTLTLGRQYRVSMMTALDHELLRPRKHLLHALVFADEGTPYRGARRFSRLVSYARQHDYELRALHRPTGQVVSRASLDALMAVTT
jgi:hypothetical protein